MKLLPQSTADFLAVCVIHQLNSKHYSESDAMQGLYQCWAALEGWKKKHLLQFEDFVVVVVVVEEGILYLQPSLTHWLGS